MSSIDQMKETLSGTSSSTVVKIRSSTFGSLEAMAHSSSLFTCDGSSSLNVFRFIDLLCLKRAGQLVRYVMSRDDIASCAEEQFPFGISCSSIDSNQNHLYVVPFRSTSIVAYRIVDTSPSIVLWKEIHDESRDRDIHGLSLSANGSFLVSVLSDQSMSLYHNAATLSRLAEVRLSLSLSLASMISSMLFG